MDSTSFPGTLRMTTWKRITCLYRCSSSTKKGKYEISICNCGSRRDRPSRCRDIPKLLIDTPHRMVIIDGDTVEEKNMVRQSYQKHDINQNKALALSKKINTFYGNICEAVDKYVTKDEIISFLRKYKDFVPVLVGCVDTDKTRLLLEAHRKLDYCTIWIRQIANMRAMYMLKQN